MDTRSISMWMAFCRGYPGNIKTIVWTDMSLFRYCILLESNVGCFLISYSNASYDYMTSLLYYRYFKLLEIRLSFYDCTTISLFYHYLQLIKYETTICIRQWYNFHENLSIGNILISLSVKRERPRFGLSDTSHCGKIFGWLAVQYKPQR